MVLEILLAVFIGLVVLAIVAYVVIIYNHLIRLRKDIDRSWSNIDVLLKQRNDEIPRLVDTVKGYMRYEKGLLNQLTKLRTQWMKTSPGAVAQRAAISEAISGVLKTILATAENYPQLRAVEGFKQLQDRVSGLENEIADRREFYNNSCTEYNIRIHSMPDVFIARMMGFTQEFPLFRATEAEREATRLEFE